MYKNFNEKLINKDNAILITQTGERYYSNLWESPKQLYVFLVKTLNEIVERDFPEQKKLINRINTLLFSPVYSDNSFLLHTIIANQTNATLQETLIKTLSLYPVLLNIAIKTCIALKSANLKTKQPINIKNYNIQMSLGLYAKETEPGSEAMIKAIANLSNGLERNESTNTIKNLVEDLWKATWANDNLNEINMQIFYADQIYNNIDKVIDNIKSSLSKNDLNNTDLDQWLNCYTWLTTDRDGRPHDTNNKTETFIKTLETAIRNNYLNELKYIEKQCQDLSLRKIICRLSEGSENSYYSPQELISDLNEVKEKSPLIEKLIIKVQVFGFHYLKLEFRDNAHMLNEVIDSLLDSAVVKQLIDQDKNYAELNRNEKIIVLTELLKEKNEALVSSIKAEYLEKNLTSYLLKKEKHKDKDYIDLIDLDPEYIKQINVESTLGRFDLMYQYSDRLHVHAIAETKGPEDALAILFLAKVNNGAIDHIDVALQPEDSGGAITIIEMIRVLYENKIYRAHLETRKNKQYIVFGPSDTGKQGGKAMHFANMRIAQIHQIIAKEFDIKPVIHTIVGYEHARCNGPLEEILDNYGTLQQQHSEYMMAGLNEMRSELLTPTQVVNFLSKLFFMHAQYDAGEKTTTEKMKEGSKFWLTVVKRYQDKFHNHSTLPDLLRKMARFDVINATAKGTRPPSRILNTKSLEDCPEAIRAIPWARAFLLSGIHAEAIGAGGLAKISSQELHSRYNTQKDFYRYVKHIAYAVARTDMNFAWLTYGCKRPNEIEIKNLANQFENNSDGLTSKHLLAWIDNEISQASRFVYKTIHNQEPQLVMLNRYDLLQKIDFALAQEVLWRDKLFSFYKILLLMVKRDPNMLKAAYIKDLFTGALTTCNTAISLTHPKSANLLYWNLETFE